MLILLCSIITLIYAYMLIIYNNQLVINVHIYNYNIYIYIYIIYIFKLYTHARTHAHTHTHTQHKHTRHTHNHGDYMAWTCHAMPGYDRCRAGAVL